MKVKDLIAKLQKMDQNATVVVCDGEEYTAEFACYQHEDSPAVVIDLTATDEE